MFHNIHAYFICCRYASTTRPSLCHDPLDTCDRSFYSSLEHAVVKVCQQFRGRMEDKEMELRMDIQPAFHYAGDGRLMEKVFSNVLGNAVAYSPVGATVTVSMQNGIFFVENSGIHIAEEDLKQIFTPFYRVDKSRNRNSGGSGLGLYITKTILDHHGINFSMNNTEDGVKFKMFL